MKNRVSKFLTFLFLFVTIFVAFSQDSLLLKKRIDSLAIQATDSNLFSLDLARQILIFLQLDTLRHRQIAEYVMKQSLKLPSRSSSSPFPSFQVQFYKLNPLYTKYRNLSEEALVRPGANTGVTVGFDLTRGLVQRLLLKGIHLPPNNFDSVRVDYLTKDTTSLPFLLLVMEHPGQNLMELYSHTKIHKRMTFSQFQNFISILIRQGLLRYITPKDELQLFFIPYSRKELLAMIQKKLELALVKKDEIWKRWIKLQKALQQSD